MRPSQTEGLSVLELLEIHSTKGQRMGPSTAWKVMPTDLQEEVRRREWTKHKVPADHCQNSQSSSKETKMLYLQNVAKFG